MQPQFLMTLLAEFKSSQRLRLGVWFVVGIVWLYVLLLLRDETDRVISEYLALAKKGSRAQAVAGQTGWAERAESAQAMQVELESRLWQESTLGLAQAALQDWLNQAIQQAALTRPFLTVVAQEEANADKGESAGISAQSLGATDIWKVSAKLSFDFVPTNYYSLMEKLANNNKQVIVESLVIRGAPVLRAEMVLVAYFQKPVATLPKGAR